MNSIDLIERTWYNIEKEMKANGISEFRQNAMKTALIQLVFKVIEGELKTNLQVEIAINNVVKRLSGT